MNGEHRIESRLSKFFDRLLSLSLVLFIAAALTARRSITMPTVGRSSFTKPMPMTTVTMTATTMATAKMMMTARTAIKTTAKAMKTAPQAPGTMTALGLRPPRTAGTTTTPSTIWMISIRYRPMRKPAW